MATPLQFDDRFRAELADLLVWRRDVRRFRPDPLPGGLIQELLALACLSPSVGFSQPWRWVIVDSPDRRAAIIANFERANDRALGDLDGARAALYARLKLAGLVEAPIHLAVFVDPTSEVCISLGAKPLPRRLQYSAVCAVHSLWLVARAHNVGLGWVSILDPLSVPKELEVPEHWKLVAYLCLGYAEEADNQPELERAGWAERQALGVVLVER